MPCLEAYFGVLGTDDRNSSAWSETGTKTLGAGLLAILCRGATPAFVSTIFRQALPSSDGLPAPYHRYFSWDTDSSVCSTLRLSLVSVTLFGTIPVSVSPRLDSAQFGKLIENAHVFSIPTRACTSGVACESDAATPSINQFMHFTEYGPSSSPSWRAVTRHIIVAKIIQNAVPLATLERNGESMVHSLCLS